MIPQSTKPWRWLYDFTQMFWNSKYDKRESGSVVIAKGILKNLYAHVEIEISERNVHYEHHYLWNACLFVMPCTYNKKNNILQTKYNY